VCAISFFPKPILTLQTTNYGHENLTPYNKVQEDLLYSLHFTHNFIQRIICNTYQNFDIPTSLEVLYFILRTLLNVRTSPNVLYFILHTLPYVLCQWRNKAKECIVTSICEYWTFNSCHLSSFLIIFVLDQTSTSFSKVWFLLTFCFESFI
jgi:hypothetical protein